MRALIIPVLVLFLQSQFAAAQTVATFGAQTCQNWLVEPTPGGLGRYWIMGGWSGLNLGMMLRHDRTDIGHTLTSEGIMGLVQGVCRQQPSMLLSEATARAWAHAKATNQ